MNRSNRSPEAERHRATLLEFITPLLAPSRSLRARRHAMEALSGFAIPVQGATIEAIAGPGVVGEWLRVAGAVPGARTIYYLHGGGYSLGSPFSHRPLVGSLAQVCEATVFSLDYRRAPEHPCPAAIDDAMAGWQWLCGQVPDPTRLVIAGDSAGAGLALALESELRQRKLTPPAGLVLLSPWTDLALTGDSLQRNADQDVMVTWPVLRQFAADYLGALNPTDTRASPLYADRRGCAPLLIQVGSEEMLLSDATRLADRAVADGVDVTLEIAAGMWHVWQAWARQVPEAQAALERVASFLERIEKRRHGPGTI